MPASLKKDKRDLLAKAGYNRADKTVLYKYTALADRLGFTSREIDNLKNRLLDREITRNTLLKARKPNRYEYNNGAFEAYVNRIVRIFITASPLLS
jgi:hypothetical protein